MINPGSSIDEAGEMRERNSVTVAIIAKIKGRNFIRASKCILYVLLFSIFVSVFQECPVVKIITR
jgi:hypothetical protein